MQLCISHMKSTLFFTFHRKVEEGLDCVEDVTERECGKEAAEYVDNMMDLMLDPILKEVNC